MPNVDRSFKDTWQTRSDTLNDLAYSDYLKSDEWLSIKKKALNRPFYKSCLKCVSKNNIHLHHRNYKWIGTSKAMMGLIPLCGKCHNEVHNYAKVNQVAVRIATNILCKSAYLKMYGKINRLQPPNTSAQISQ
jgi:5-methylcytosine-specific restriction endonuclease McrA